MAKSTPATTAYVVTHSMLGPHLLGEVISFTEEQIKQGIDVSRLLTLRALREATEADGTPVRFGQARVEVPVTFPAVPFQATATETA